MTPFQCHFQNIMWTYVTLLPLLGLCGIILYICALAGLPKMILFLIQFSLVTFDHTSWNLRHISIMHKSKTYFIKYSMCVPLMSVHSLQNM